jgi:hypothetical protein
MRKLVLLIILALMLVGAFSASTAMAAPPDVQPWMYTAVRDAGFPTVEAVQTSFGYFQTAQAVKYSYTPAQWELFYNRDVSAFLAQRGCASCWITDADVLSYKMKIDLPIALCDAGKGQCAD